MTTCVALFRGINVGGKNLLPMKKLVPILTSLGYTDIRTYIQSGNVVMNSPRRLSSRTSASIAGAIENAAGFRPDVMVLDAAAFRKAAAASPFDLALGKEVHLFFLGAPARAPDRAGLEADRKLSERFHLTDKVFYLHAPEGIGRSRLATRVERRLGVPGTGRNGNTIMKLLEMLD